MRQLFRTATIATAVVLAAPLLSAPAIAQVASLQDASLAAFDGDWEGALDIQGQQLRLVLKVQTTDGKTSGVLISLDQNGEQLPLTSISRTETGLTFLIARIDGRFDGKVSADTNTLDGTWVQYGNELPLKLSRKAT